MADLRAIQRAFRDGDFRLTVHGSQELTADDLSVRDAVNAILSSEVEVIEDYPNDLRGSCCLVAGTIKGGEYIRLVVSYPPRPKVITGYRLNPDEWEDFRTRRQP